MSNRGRARHGEADIRGTAASSPLGCPAWRTMAFTEHDPDLSRFTSSHQLDVVLVEDHRLFREGLVELLGAVDPRLKVTATCDSAEEALKVIPRLMPDVVLMDIHLSEMSGIQAIQRLAVL